MVELVANDFYTRSKTAQEELCAPYFERSAD
jgi:hypothetical protein